MPQQSKGKTRRATRELPPFVVGVGSLVCELAQRRAVCDTPIEFLAGLLLAQQVCGCDQNLAPAANATGLDWKRWVWEAELLSWRSLSQSPLERERINSKE